MEQLTAQQAKMVIEHFAQQAAQDAPDTTDWKVWERHLWMTMYETSIVIQRQIKANDWDKLVNDLITLQSFDRDPSAYFYGLGIVDDTEQAKADYSDYLKQQVNWGIDNVLRNSGA